MSTPPGPSAGMESLPITDVVGLLVRQQAILGLDDEAFKSTLPQSLLAKLPSEWGFYSQRVPRVPSPTPSVGSKRAHSSSDEAVMVDCLSSDSDTDHADSQLGGFLPVKTKTQKKREKNKLKRRRAAAASASLESPASPTFESQNAFGVLAPELSSDPPAKVPRPPSRPASRPSSRTGTAPSRGPQASPAAPPAPRVNRENAEAEDTKPLPPPVFLRGAKQWGALSTQLRDKRIHVLQASVVQVGIRIQVQTKDDFRALVKHLDAQKQEYHTYALEEERRLKAVIRGLHREVSTEEVKADLLAQKFPVLAVHRMHDRNRQPMPLVIVVLEKNDKGKSIFNLKSVLGLSGIKVETPNGKGMPAQCHRCQLYGHAARNCRAAYRCVKCLAPHATHDCKRNRDTDGPPACVLCGLHGHPANYRGCRMAPRAKPSNGNSGSRPPRDSAKPSPDTGDKAKFPALKVRRGTSTPAAPTTGPAPANQELTWRKRDPRTQAQGTAAAASPRPQPKPKQTQGGLANSPGLLDDLKLLLEVANKVDLKEVELLANKIRQARNHTEMLLALVGHTDLLKVLRDGFYP